MARCAGKKGDGSPCERIIGASQTYCYSHNPDHAEARKKTASKAGRSRKPLTEITEVKSRLREIAEGVISGEIDKGRGSVAIQGYGVMVRAVEATRRIHETEELEKRLAELEQQHAQ